MLTLAQNQKKKKKNHVSSQSVGTAETPWVIAFLLYHHYVTLHTDSWEVSLYLRSKWLCWSAVLKGTQPHYEVPTAGAIPAKVLLII